MSEEFEVKLGMHQESVLLLFIVFVVDVTELAREDALSELLYAGDLVLVSETIELLNDMFLKWKEAFKSKGLKVYFGKPKVMVIMGFTMDGLSKSNVVSCGICSLSIKVFFVQCGKWIHGRCAGVDRVIPEFSVIFTCRKCEENIAESVVLEERYVME